METTQEQQSMPDCPHAVVENPINSRLTKTQVPEQKDIESSDDDIILPVSHRKRRLESKANTSDPIAASPKTSGKNLRKNKRSLNASLKHAETNESQDETPRPLRRLKRKAESSPIVLSDSDDSEEPVLSSPVKRRGRIADIELPETPRGGTHQHNLDIEEDLKDLEDSGTVNDHYPLA